MKNTKVKKIMAKIALGTLVSILGACSSSQGLRDKIGAQDSNNHNKVMIQVVSR